MMNLEKYIAQYMKKEFSESSFQIWNYDAAVGNAQLLKDRGREKSDSVPECNPNIGCYYIKKGDVHTDLHFYYLKKHGIVLRIFKRIETVSNSVMEHLFYCLRSGVLEERLDTKTQEQKVLMESMHSISSSLNLDHVLKTIIRHALNVIPAADAGYLMIYNLKKQKLIPKAPVGFNDSIYQFQTRIGESITGKVFEDGKSRIYNSYEEIIAAMHAHLVLPENFQQIHLSSNGVEGAICVPVAIDANRIGVMIIHQCKLRKRLDQEDMMLLEGFATQAAIAIQNAQYYTETKEQLQQITNLSAQLKERNAQLQKRQEVHDTLTMLSLKNKGIHLLVEGMQNMMDRKVIFFNGLENDFYSVNENETAVFSVFEIRTLFSERRMDFYATTDKEACFYFYPIYNGEIFIGCLIIPLDTPISDFDRITLEQGSTVLALELVNRQTATKIYHRSVYEQFRKLLACEDRNRLIQYGKEMNLDINGYWMVAVLEIPKERVDLQYLDIHVHQLASRINSEIGDREKLVYGFYNKISLLVPLSNREEVNEIKAKLKTVRIQQNDKGSAIFRGGLSSVYKGLEFIRKCFDEANKTISYLSSRSSLEVIRYEEIGLDRLFLNQPSGDIEQFIQETLSPLTKENSRYKELEKTLLAYVEANRSPGKTAKLLHIHINTLYQRLQTIEELLGVDLNNSEDILKIQLACHLKQSQMALRDG
ncbi:helix-turn-helix domain-containing protein [Oceanobacillus sp. FSL K6-2867]|uniref:helix-turn-helix domain-containing protein n=1 Tax=Oceanobacillus sp. FSL K6-2867 TaxID=2954748 RepID=UPI0030DAC24F